MKFKEQSAKRAGASNFAFRIFSFFVTKNQESWQSVRQLLRLQLNKSKLANAALPRCAADARRISAFERREPARAHRLG
jgi:hypothetical protein